MKKQKRKRRVGRHFSTLHSVVRYLRKRRGITLTEMSMMCGRRVRPNEICKVEHGQLNVQLSKLMVIADFFGISIQAIIDNDFCAVLCAIPAESETQHRIRAKLKRRKTRTKKDAAGERGEELVLAMEKRKLKDSGLDTLVCGDFADDETAGFDVFSFTEDGNPLYIEVKSSLGLDDSFYVSANELNFAAYCAENEIPYQLVRIKGVMDSRKRTITVFSAEDVLQMSKKVQTYLVKEG